MNCAEIWLCFFLVLLACFLWSWLPSGLVKGLCLILAIITGFAYGHNFDVGFFSGVWITVIFCLLFQLFRRLKNAFEIYGLDDPIMIIPIALVSALSCAIGIITEGLANGILIGLVTGAILLCAARIYLVVLNKT